MKVHLKATFAVAVVGVAAQSGTIPYGSPPGSISGGFSMGSSYLGTGMSMPPSGANTNPSASLEDCASASTVTLDVTVTKCPDCETPTVMPTSKTTYTTEYQYICPTGIATSTYTITETCKGATPACPKSSSGHIPDGFTTTTTLCGVCGPTPTPMTLTAPCKSCSTPTPPPPPPPAASNNVTSGGVCPGYGLPCAPATSATAKTSALPASSASYSGTRTGVHFQLAVAILVSALMGAAFFH